MHGNWRQPMKWSQKVGRASMVVVTLAGVTPTGWSADKPSDIRIAQRANQVRGDEITPKQQDAVSRGLAYMASKQAPNGSFGSGYGSAGGHAGITALGGLAFMAAGNLPGRGKYGDNVQKCLGFVMNSSQETGLIASDNSHGSMYGHG